MISFLFSQIYYFFISTRQVVIVVFNLAKLFPLHFAADQGYLEIIEMLLNAGAVPAADKKNLQPQDVAASKGHSAIVELLQSTRGSHGQSTGDSSR